MSESLPTKCITVANAIAITAAIAVISGHLPLNFSPLAELPISLHLQQVLPRR